MRVCWWWGVEVLAWYKCMIFAETACVCVMKKGGGEGRWGVVWWWRNFIICFENGKQSILSCLQIYCTFPSFCFVYEKQSTFILARNIYIWIMDPHSRGNTSHGNVMLPQDTTHLIQRPCYQQGSPCQDPAGNWTTWRPPYDHKETQTAVVWSCLPFIRSGQNHFSRHSERGKKTRQTEEEVGRQHQGMNRPEVRQVPEGSGEQGKMEKTDCKIICGAPTTLAVKGLMMMMMMRNILYLSVLLCMENEAFYHDQKYIIPVHPFVLWKWNTLSWVEMYISCLSFCAWKAKHFILTRNILYLSVLLCMESKALYPD